MFYKFVAKHRFISFVLISAVICAPYSFLLNYLHAPLWVTISIDLLLLFLILLFVNLSLVFVLKKPSEELNNRCDPYPLLEAIEWLFSIKVPKFSVKMIKLNYSSSLNHIGEMQKSYDVISSLNVEEIHSDLTKLDYYHILFIANLNVGNIDRLTDLLSEFQQIYSNIKGGKFKDRASSLLYYMEALLLRENEEYSKALEMLDKCDTDTNTLYGKVIKADQRAKLYLALDEKEKAREMLEFVINNGNKLFVVAEAREALSNL